MLFRVHAQIIAHAFAEGKWSHDFIVLVLVAETDIALQNCGYKLMEFATDLRFSVDVLRHALMLNRPRLIMCGGFRSKALLI